MTAEVIYLTQSEDNHGNGAVDLIAEYFSHVYPARLMARLRGETELSDEDHFLAWLAAQGFLIVPFEPELSA